MLVDATLGAGGHAERFLTELPGLRLIGLDRDPDALWIAGERLAPFGDRVTAGPHPLRRDRGRAGRIRLLGNESEVDGVLFDLGVSSMQLDRTERGFSYSADAPLDMRMDPDAALTAAEVVNTYDEKALARILREFGEERFAGRIAAQIVRRRARTPFATHRRARRAAVSGDPRAGPAHRRASGQAHVPGAAHRRQRRAGLAARRAARRAGRAGRGGRIVVMAYQSLEDRIVKNLFAAATASRTPPGLPVELPGHEPEFVA